MSDSPIYLLDDDEDDYFFIKETMRELGLKNEIKYFTNGNDFITYLKSTSEIPFLILCDVNVFPLDGFDVRQMVKDNPDINYKSIPFIFWSNNASETQIQKAYDLAVHGFFTKGSTIEEMKQFIKIIVDYWRLSMVPQGKAGY